MKNNSIALSYLFTPRVLKDIYQGQVSNKIFNIFKELNMQDIFNENITLKDLFERSYKQLLKNYRNEYVFKNAIAQKILLGRHSIKSSSLFTELRVETSKADVVIFNGTSHVYEIKTDLDNFERLESQINNYKKVFEFVNIVSVESKVEAIKSLIDEDVGIIVLTDRYTLKTIRKAKSGLMQLDRKSLFNLLRKNEYIQIVKKHYDYIPDVPNTKIYMACKELFIKLPIDIVHKEVLGTLKKRKNHHHILENINKFPDSLKVAILEANLNEKQQVNFLNFLNKKVNNLFTKGAINVSSIS